MTRRTDKQDAALRRLKQRIARVSWRFDDQSPFAIRREIGRCIDEWARAEQRKAKP